jgi:hypothetical protein
MASTGRRALFLTMPKKPMDASVGPADAADADGAADAKAGAKGTGTVVKYASADELTEYMALVSPFPPASGVDPVLKPKAKSKVGTMFGLAPAVAKAPAAAAKAAKPAGEPKQIPLTQAQEPLQQQPLLQKQPETQDFSKYGALAAAAASIHSTEFADPYTISADESIYPMQTRLGFQQQILKVYNNFIKIPEHGKEPDYDACKKMGAAGGTQVEMYEYQKFVREYVRQASPYRGILVYHGLGSGKTCSAIAAAEALFSVSRKKIIVMTPSSLRYNFIREISFCGFRHLRLQNFWEAMDVTPENQETVQLFATQILNMSPKAAAAAKRIWVPNFEVPEPNFKTLGDAERKEITAQIENQISNTIQFVNYNGIRSSKLKKYACDPPDENGYRFFDNSVIVVDEIHNLTRLMQGTIEPYLMDIGGGKRKVPLEPVAPGQWEPALCKVATDERRPYLTNYKRGYLLYRLISGARNSKIIGLSGTPLINFPEEIAILANLIGGYIHTCSMKATPSDRYREVRALLQKNPYVDFEEVDTLGGNVQILFSILPEGMIKATTESGNLGVQRIAPGESTPTIQETAGGIVKELTEMGLRIVDGPTYKSEALLPPIGEEFRENFLNGLDLKNTVVLRKRLQGLVSYYRGSKKELMPAVTRDEVVFVQFSEYARREYERVRGEELTAEKEKKKGPEGALAGVGKMANLWADIYDLAKLKQPNSYRMSSRQACNFAFPEGIVRPRPRDIGEAAVDIGAAAGAEEEAAEAGDDAVGEEAEEAEAFAAAAEAAARAAGEFSEEGEDAVAAAEEDIALDDAEKAALVEEGMGAEEVDALLGAEPVLLAAPGPATGANAEALPKVGGSELEGVSDGILYEEQPPTEGGGDEVPGAAAAVPPAPAPAPKPKAMGLTAANVMKKKRDACLASIVAANLYLDKTRLTKECMRIYDNKKLFLFTPGQDPTQMARTDQSPDPMRLIKYSPKYAKIIYNILTAPGSSLVYSQFLDMEGIGIFSIVLGINGFHPIEILSDEAGMYFSDATVANLKLGPAKNRFLTFTGASGKAGSTVRNMALKVFNAKFEDGKFTELPPRMSQVLVESGFTGNSDGSLCRTFCITSAGAEGLSLKNVRRVHIMEPFWNSVRTDQVKGRAVRICSHIDLDLAERNVEVFTYCSVFDAGSTEAAPVNIESEIIRANDGIKPEEATAMGFTVRPGAKEYILTSDQHLYQLSERKKKVLQNIQNLMKTNAVDCAINQYENEEEGLGCITLPDNPKQYAFHPVLKKDIAETSTRFPKDSLGPGAALGQGEAAPALALAQTQGEAAPAAAVPAAQQQPRGKVKVEGFVFTYQGVPYISVADQTSPLTQSLYARGDSALSKKLGEYSVDRDGRRISEIRWITKRF